MSTSGSSAAELTRQAREAARHIQERIGFAPSVALILGSGLGRLAELVQGAERVSFSDLPGFVSAGVSGHAGEFVAGKLFGVPVILQSGRFHLYEEHPHSVVAAPVRTLAALGVKKLIISNAAGGIRDDLQPGNLLLISDHLNLSGTNVLIGPALEGETRFPDMTEAYSRTMRRAARDAASQEQIPLTEGVYAALLGPSYETPAEIRMLRGLGADAVGMSTVPEVTVARACGIECLGFSAITNKAAGLGGEELDHSEVLDSAMVAGEKLSALMSVALERISGPAEVE